MAKCRITEHILQILVILLTVTSLSYVKGCEYWEWRCKNGECITLKSRCNGQYECRDQSDESDCPAGAPTTFSPGCPDGMFQCHNKKCYYIEWHCDGTNDCTDGTDEQNCPGFEDGLMPTSSVIAMSVTVGGLFLLLIGIIIMITCVRRKNGRRPSFPRRGNINEVIYPGNRYTPGLIACPTISGEIVMREPPPRYTSEPDIYTTRSTTAAVNFAFSADEQLSRPPPCYSSHPNLVNDMSNLSICSSVEPPPSYTSQHDQNVLDTTIIEGAINLSFCPDEGDLSFPRHNVAQTSNNTMDSSYYSIHSMRSWADNLDVETLSLGSQIDQQENLHSDDCRELPNLDSSYNEHLQQRTSVDQFQRNEYSMPGAKFQKARIPHRSNYAAKMSSRVQRAKALGRQYSSTPVLIKQTSSPINHRRVSLDTNDVEHSVTTNYKYPKYSKPHNNCVERRVRSAAQLDQNSNPEYRSRLQKDTDKAESTTCCNSRSSLAKTYTGGHGLKFWRNNKTSMSTACVSTCKSEVSIPETFESDEGFQDDSETASSVQEATKSLHASTKSVNTIFFTPNITSTSLSQLYLADMNSVGSNSSVNSWEC